jgi:hypothetical protein
MDINFYGQSDIFLNNFSAKFKYKIFHGHWPQHMANCPPNLKDPDFRDEATFLFLNSFSRRY